MDRDEEEASNIEGSGACTAAAIMFDGDNGNAEDMKYGEGTGTLPS